MAQTRTSTNTYSRIIFLQIQITELLKKTTQISDSMLDKILVAVVNKWICQIDVYAFNSSNLCQAQLKMEIDWNEYEQQISSSKTTIAVHPLWTNDLLPQTDSAIWTFNEYVSQFRLTTKWLITYADWVYNNSSKLTEAREFLGTSPSKSIRWSGNTISDFLKNTDVPEFCIGLYLVE
jgi:hypothetical protein